MRLYAGYGQPLIKAKGRRKGKKKEEEGGGGKGTGPLETKVDPDFAFLRHQWVAVMHPFDCQPPLNSTRRKLLYLER